MLGVTPTARRRGVSRCAADARASRRVRSGQRTLRQQPHAPGRRRQEARHLQHGDGVHEADLVRRSLAVRHTMPPPVAQQMSPGEPVSSLRHQTSSGGPPRRPATIAFWPNRRARRRARCTTDAQDQQTRFRRPGRDRRLPPRRQRGKAEATRTAPAIGAGARDCANQASGAECGLQAVTKAQVRRPRCFSKRSSAPLCWPTRSAIGPPGASTR